MLIKVLSVLSITFVITGVVAFVSLSIIVTSVAIFKPTELVVPLTYSVVMLKLSLLSIAVSFTALTSPSNSITPL